MKVSAITVALFFALGSTLAVAQGAGGAGTGGGGHGCRCVRCKVVAAPAPAALVVEPPVRVDRCRWWRGAQPEQLEQPAQLVALPT
jgi:hypothetical protein